jgi:hypothetical protein
MIPATAYAHRAIFHGALGPTTVASRRDPPKSAPPLRAFISTFHADAVGPSP